MTSICFKRCIPKNVTIFKQAFALKNQPQPLILSQIKHSFNRNLIFQTKFISNEANKYSLKKTFDEDNKKKDDDDINSETEIRTEAEQPKITEPVEPNPGLFKRFKQMYRDYWYVLVPVHLVTSAGWFGGFYYMAKSGVDIVALLQTAGLSETIINPLKDSSMGYIAISYAMYKIATPIRYTITLGGTTLSIKYLREWGYIKPVPSKEKLKEMYNERRDSFRETIQETKEELRQRKDQLKERKDNILGDYVNFKKELKDIKTKTAPPLKPLPKVMETFKDKQ